jgi:hypothetical protein
MKEDKFDNTSDKYSYSEESLLPDEVFNPDGMDSTLYEESFSSTVEKHKQGKSRSFGETNIQKLIRFLRELEVAGLCQSALPVVPMIDTVIEILFKLQDAIFQERPREADKIAAAGLISDDAFIAGEEGKLVHKEVFRLGHSPSRFQRKTCLTNMPQRLVKLPFDRAKPVKDFIAKDIISIIEWLCLIKVRGEIPLKQFLGALNGEKSENVSLPSDVGPNALYSLLSMLLGKDKSQEMEHKEKVKKQLELLGGGPPVNASFRNLLPKKVANVLRNSGEDWLEAPRPHKRRRR